MTKTLPEKHAEVLLRVGSEALQGVKHEEVGELVQLLGTAVQPEGAAQARMCLALPL